MQPQHYGQQQQYMQQELLLEPRQQQQQQQQQQQHYNHHDSEIERLQQQCRSSLVASLRIVGETNQTSQQTAMQLAAQSEQLERIADTTEEIGGNLQTSKYLLGGLKSWWGSFAQLFTAPTTSSSSSSSSSSSRRRQQQQQQGQGQGQGRYSDAAAAGDGSSGGDFAGSQQQQQQQLQREQIQVQQQQQLLQQQRLSLLQGRDAAAATTDSDFDDGVQRDLQRLSLMLGELEGRAAAINKELQQQNETLNFIVDGVQTNKKEMEKQKLQIKQILKR
ncbi:synaptosomal-associated protein 25, putative [Eimeria mitis]|uniref:Synaptosomal-associated protein 25, putative n=1 Tax=Eimeria mitis TaxID=44415 RepID=U6K1S5_9EIME|nr:synaptosomal-associated protein 25, putative [Eimeria mitis]CDJ31695.1 synaptosomal-associated protein 25, putative [Eimeria mitis]